MFKWKELDAEGPHKSTEWKLEKSDVESTEYRLEIVILWAMGDEES